MLFLQPVVVHDSYAAQRSQAAEVQVVERALEPPSWDGVMLAQGPTDQRSPFGSGAPDRNDGTPNFAPPPNPPSREEPAEAPAKGPLADPASKKVPPPPSRPDAGPPPPTGKFTTHTDTFGPLAQGAVPDTTTNVPGAPTTPGALPGTTTPGLGGTSGTMTTPGTTTTPGRTGTTGTGGTSGTIAPGVVSGASNTR
jgi:hypothetical protein